MKYNDNMIFNEKKGKWYSKGVHGSWILKESCKHCGEKYFTRYDKPSEYCSYSCARSGKGNPMYGKTHTDEVRLILKNKLIETTNKIKQKYHIDNISQLETIKRKKNQTILSKEYIRQYVSIYGYELIEKDELNNKHTLLTLKCPVGHVFNIKYCSFRAGRRCIQCFYDSLKKQWDIDNIEKYYEYKKVVTRLTNKNYRKYKNIINPKNYKRGRKPCDFQLDHKFSVLEGYKQNIDPEIISSYVNLEMLSVYDNASKQDKCSITKEQLLEMYSNIS